MYPSLYSGTPEGTRVVDPGVARLRQRWFGFYLEQGYSERQSMILVDQIFANSYCQGSPGAGNDQYCLAIRGRRRPPAETHKYIALASTLAVRDVLAAFFEAHHE